MSKHNAVAPLPNTDGHHTPKVTTIHHLQQYKTQGRRLVCLTAYDYTTAQLLDSAGVDLLLVGDSLAMTVLGHENTLSVTVEEMLHHVKAVSRGTRHALVVADMPFMSYHGSEDQAVINAGRFIQEGRAHAVKLEGASPRIQHLIERLVVTGIPVLGHLGLTPQAIHTVGGFKLQAKTTANAEQLMQDALALEAAGAFALVLEMVPTEVAAWISTTLKIPTIGIGAGPGCDGQILVVDDFLGRFQEFQPRFVRRYAAMAELTKAAVTQYREDIQEQHFPNPTTEAFALSPEVADALGLLPYQSAPASSG
ncbi:MAG: 3-methyl-2-oxobutanoate hydroxymethyltransferase [Candidatus Melainabacteria bacterium]|nr:3-methyl-2-oxobutanoate hydroxymethyltransferase [Candidatus Melainabacteria bacterium]